MKDAVLFYDIRFSRIYLWSGIFSTCSTVPASWPSAARAVVERRRNGAQTGRFEIYLGCHIFRGNVLCTAPGTWDTQQNYKCVAMLRNSLIVIREESSIRTLYYMQLIVT